MISPERIDRYEDKTAPLKTGFTPQELVRRQIEDQDYHVTDEDMENMIISDELPEEEEIKAVNDADELENEKAGSSYDVMD